MVASYNDVTTNIIEKHAEAANSMKRYTRDGEGRFKEVEIRDWRLENGFELFQRGFGIRESDSLHAEFFARFDIFRHIVHEHRFFWLDL